MKCRHCGAPLALTLVDLGSAPPSNAYLTAAPLDRPERWYPLRVLVCERCWLVQTQDFADAHELFDGEYAYFSSFSSTWVEHARRYVDAMTARVSLDGSSMVVEEFFGEALGRRLASEGRAADLTAANNVLAHVPDINDFLRGFMAILKPAGVATFEFPHLLRLLDGLQFDTIYHEHFSYLSMLAVDRMMRAAGLEPFAVEELPTHGGSLRVFAQRADTRARGADGSVDALLERERAAGLASAAPYAGFQAKAERIRDDLVTYLIEAKRAGRTVAAYGAAAKGNTLLNFAGVRPDLVRYVVDRNPAKQGKFMPGSRIPIVGSDRLAKERPDDLLVLPWNLLYEVRAENSALADAGTRFVVAVPRMKVS